MDETMIVEKGIGVYLIFLGGLDQGVIFNQTIWPISSFVITSYTKTSDLQEIGLYAGLIILSYSLGKLLGFKIISLLTRSLHIKTTLMVTLLGSSLSILGFGLFDSITGAIFCRFICGIFSNLQQSTRRFLLGIETQGKGDWPKLSKRCLYANRIGMIFGISISGFLSNCQDFLPQESKFVEKKFLLSSLILFIMKLSGVLLAFSIETSIPPELVKQKYVELPEVKEKKNQEESESPSKENNDISDYFHGEGIIINEMLQSEESVNRDEVKFYSPRNIVNRDLSMRKLNSARPKLESFSFPDPHNDTKELEKPEGDGKRTHISFIEEEDFEVAPEPLPSTPKKELEIMRYKPEDNSYLKFAVVFRMVLSFLLAMTLEAIPYWFFLANKGENIYVVTASLLVVYFAGSMVSLCTTDKLLERYSCAVLIKMSLIIQIGLLFVVPFMSIFSLPTVFAVPVFVGAFYVTELLMPFGSVMIADSVKLAFRESSVEKSDLLSIPCKGLGGFLGLALLGKLGNFCFSFWINAAGLLVLVYMNRKTSDYFYMMGTAPYKL